MSPSGSLRPPVGIGSGGPGSARAPVSPEVEVPVIATNNRLYNSQTTAWSEPFSNHIHISQHNYYGRLHAQK